MLRALKTALWNLFFQIPDPRTMDAASMTLHDCIRLIEQSHARKQFEDRG